MNQIVIKNYDGNFGYWLDHIAFSLARDNETFIGPSSRCLGLRLFGTIAEPFRGLPISTTERSHEGSDCKWSRAWRAWHYYLFQPKLNFLQLGCLVSPLTLECKGWWEPSNQCNFFTPARVTVRASSAATTTSAWASSASTTAACLAPTARIAERWRILVSRPFDSSHYLTNPGEPSKNHDCPSLSMFLVVS